MNPFLDQFFWWIIGGVVACLLIATGIIWTSNRSHQRIDHAPTTPEMPSTATGGQVERVEPASGVEVPEAAGSRMARLRRRLAGSNNALARGLADLIARDRLDEDT